MIPEPMNRQRSHSMEHHSATEPEVSTSDHSHGVAITPDRLSRKPAHVRTNFPKAVYNPPSPTPQHMMAKGTRPQQQQHGSRSSSPMRSSSPSMRSSSPMMRSSSPMPNASPSRQSWKRHNSESHRQQHQPQQQSMSHNRYQQAMMAEEQHLDSKTPDARSVVTEIPFDQAFDLTKGDCESLGPGRIHSAAVARPPPSPSMSRRSPHTSSPVHASPVMVIPNSSYSPSNSVHSATSGSRSNIRPRLLAEGPIPYDEIVGRPRSSSQTSLSPSHGGAAAATAAVPMGDTLLRKSRDFTPAHARNSPLLAALASEDLDDDQRQQQHSEQEHPSFQSNYKMAPPRVSVPVSRPYVDEDPSALTGELSFEKPRHLSARVLPEVEDEDSLFDFEERNRKKRQEQLQQQQQRGQRSRARESFAGEETDDSDMLPPVSLQERAQAAWKRKQRLSQQNHQAEAASVEPSLMKLDSQPVVSFGKDDVVHNYDPQDDTLEDMLEDTLDDATLAGRSLNSLYTKSAESEVEDIIKDIFMIGSGEGTNPGRRKVKYNPRIQARNNREAQPELEREPEPEDESFEDDDNTFDTKEEEEDDDDDEEDDDTYEETLEDTTATFTEATGTHEETTDTSYPTNSDSVLFEDTCTTNTDTHDDTTATETNTAVDESTLTYTDGETTGETTVSPPSFWPNSPRNSPPPQKAASPPSQQSKPKKSVTFNDEKKDDDPLVEAWNFMEGSFSAMGAALGLDNDSKNVLETPRKTTTSLPKPRSSRDAEYTDEESATMGSATTGTLTAGGGGGWNFFDFASEVLLGPVKCEPARQELIKSAPSLEEDSRLVDLAMQAAVTMHRLNGYEFDTSRDVDINHEIKFSVVDLPLPLGIIFQENEKGCFVTKILPDGSAARTNGDIQIGDQLAAVDGTSAIDMTVDEIASMVRVKKQVIELTFLRYVGPLRPEIGTVIQEEGYEIRAAENRGKLMARQTSVAKTMPVAAVSPIPPLRNNVKPKGILKNRVTPPPVEPPPKPKAKEKIAEEPVAAQAASPSKDKKRFRLFGRRKKHK